MYIFKLNVTLKKITCSILVSKAINKKQLHLKSVETF